MGLCRPLSLLLLTVVVVLRTAAPPLWMVLGLLWLLKLWLLLARLLHLSLGRSRLMTAPWWTVMLPQRTTFLWRLLLQLQMLWRVVLVPRLSPWMGPSQQRLRPTLPRMPLQRPAQTWSPVLLLLLRLRLR